MGRVLRTWASMCSLLLVFGLAGCPVWPERAAGEAPGARLAVPDGNLGRSAAWLPDGWIYFLWTSTLSVDHKLQRVAPDMPAESVDLPNGQCLKTEYGFPHALPDGRLGITRTCTQLDPTQSTIELVAYDPAAKTFQTLAPIGQNNPTGVTWRRDLKTGFLSSGSGICDGLGPVTRQGIGRFPGPFTLDGRTWRLEEGLFQSGAEDCTPQGRAVVPMLTPDDRRLVFLASPESQGHTDWRRLNDPWNVYVMDLPDGTPRRVAGGFDERGAAMSPDGRRVAVTGRRDSQQGLWLVELDTGEMQMLSDAYLAVPVFSPDGRKLLVAFTPKEDHHQLRMLDVPAT